MLKLRTLFVIAAWVTLALICFVTLSPIGLRPETGAVGPERFLAFAFLGFTFVMSYPHRFTSLSLFVIALTLSLEALQHLTPDRHGHLADAIEKIAGGLAGCCLAKLVEVFKEKRKGN